MTIHFNERNRNFRGRVDVDGPDVTERPTSPFGRLDEPTQEDIAADCQVDRVVVLHKPGNEKNDNDVVGRTRSDKRGRWHLPIGARTGSFFAFVKKSTFTTEDGTDVTCESDRSRNLKAPRQ